MKKTAIITRLKRESCQERLYQVILGGVLGDGSLKIQKRYRNARYQIRHSIAQKDYKIWKHKLLSEVALTRLQKQKKSFFSTKDMINFQKEALKALTQIHSIVCKDNRLHIDMS